MQDYRLQGTAVSEHLREWPWPDDLSAAEVQKLASIADRTGRSPAKLVEQHRAGDGLSTNSDGDGDAGDEREALIEAIAMHTEHTVDELRDLDVDELQELVESLDLPDDVSTQQVKAALIETRVADLEQRQAELLGNSASGSDDDVDVDLETASIGGAFASMEDDGGSDAGDDALNSANIGGAFSGSD